MSEDPFDRICGTLDFPMAIATAFDGREHSGCLVGFHTQCSIAPRRWLVCISKTNHTYRILRGAQRLVVHLLRADQRDLAQLFGGVTGDAIAPHEKFERCRWRADVDGTPILERCDWFAGPILERLDAGDHVAHLVEITAAAHEHDVQEQLGFQQANDLTPGHLP